MNLEEMLRDEISEELKGLKDLELGKEDYKVAVDGVTKLTDRLIEMQKLEADIDEKNRRNESDDELKKKQMKYTRNDNIVKNVISVAGIVIPTVLTAWGTIKSFEFEKEGTITTLIGRGFINKLLKK